jgi:hypothetical protein
MKRPVSVGCTKIKVELVQPTDITRTQYTKCRMCSVSWGWASNARNIYRPLILNKLNKKCITLVSLYWNITHSAGFEHAIPALEVPQTYASDHTTTGIDHLDCITECNFFARISFCILLLLIPVTSRAHIKQFSETVKCKYFYPRSTKLSNKYLNILVCSSRRNIFCWVSCLAGSCFGLQLKCLVLADACRLFVYSHGPVFSLGRHNSS